MVYRKPKKLTKKQKRLEELIKKRKPKGTKKLTPKQKLLRKYGLR